MVNPETGDHIYIADVLDVSEFRQAGYQCELLACYVPNEPMNDTVPFHQFCGSTEHICIVGDRDSSIVSAAGYKHELVACYVFPSQIHGTIQLHRLYRPGTDSSLDWIHVLETAGRIAEITLGIIAIIQWPSNDDKKPKRDRHCVWKFCLI